MKKTLIALALSTAMLGGCVSTEPTDYSALGNEIAQQKYTNSVISDLEKIRLPINETFGSAKEIYDTYMAKVEQSPAYSNYMKATEGKSTEEIQEIHDNLTEEDRKSIATFEEANSGILMEIGELTVKLYAYVELIGNFNATAAIAQVGFSDMGQEKDNVSYTYDQIDYLSSTIGHIYKLSDVDSANRRMQ
jgi:hypothetical protein